MKPQDLAADIPASLVVFLIALPLSMGIAIASGVPPALGLVTAMIGGLVVGTLGGAPLQISGPSAGLTVLVMQMHREHGMEAFGVIVLIAGALQILAGVFKVGRQFQAVSPAVIRGMLAGIGVLIILSQFHVMLDRDIPGTGVDNFLAIPIAVWRTVSETRNLTHDEAALVGVGTLVVVIMWDKLKAGKLTIVPGPLVGVVLAAALAALLELPIRYVAVPADLTELINLPTWSSLELVMNSEVLTAGVALAFVASAETLLCASAVARMHDRGSTNYDRELAVHGIANSLCGIVGTLPMTGVISRSTANVEAGAKSRWAAPMHAIWIGAFVLLLPDLLALVPTSSLAAILIYIGFKLINPAAIRSLSRFGKPILVIFGATLVGVVAIDLLKGIIIGLTLSGMRLVYKMSHVHFELKRDTRSGEEGQPDRWDLYMHGSATFLGLPKLQDVIEEVKPGVALHIHFEGLDFIDHGCLDLLIEFRARHEKTGGRVTVEWDDLLLLRHKKSTAMVDESRAWFYRDPHKQDPDERPTDVP